MSIIGVTVSFVEIFTIGTSNRELNEFIEILKEYGIEVAADVRRFPFSRRFPQFCQDSLSFALENAQIEYLYLGLELGGLRKGGYDRYTETEEFKKGLEKLERIASRSRTVFFCCERLFFRCHRRFIARALKNRGWKVYHIIDRDNLREEKGGI